MIIMEKIYWLCKEKKAFILGAFFFLQRTKKSKSGNRGIKMIV